MHENIKISTDPVFTSFTVRDKQRKASIKMRRLREKEREKVVEMRQVEQIMPTVPGIGLGLKLAL